MRYTDLYEARPYPRTVYGPNPFAVHGNYELVIHTQTPKQGVVEVFATVYLSGVNKVKSDSMVFRGTPEECSAHTDYIEQAALGVLHAF